MTKTEALDIFEENIPDIEHAMRSNWAWKISLLKKPSPKLKFSLFQVKSWVYLQQLEELRQQFQPTIRLIELRSQPKRENMITDIDIQRAKEYPIENLVGETRRGMCICPLHNEKSPSFQVKKNNTFVCYGCSEYGDVIDLYMKMNNAKFLDAVRQLI